MQVLAAYVKSVEDHGYILHFGLSSFMGFLPNDSSTGKHQSTVVSSCYSILSSMFQPCFLMFFFAFLLIECLQKARAMK